MSNKANMVTHCLKIKSEHYINVINGTKTAETKKPKIIENDVSIINVSITHKNDFYAGIALVTDDMETVILTPHLKLLLEIRDGINNEIKASGIKEAVSNAINMVLRHIPMLERELTWQLYRYEILSYADALKNNPRS